jgi:hypothetical protein
MRTGYLAMAVALLLPVHASAQCEPRGAFGGAVGLLTLDFPVDPVAAGLGRNGLATTTGNGIEGAAHAVVPVAPAWSLTAEFGVGSMATEQERDAAGEYVARSLDERMKVQRLQIGLQRHRAHTSFCDYLGGSVGVYRYSFNGVTLAVPGVAVTMGFEFPQQGSGAFFFELGMSVGLTKLEPPTDAELVVNIRPAFGWRYRF